MKKPMASACVAVWRKWWLATHSRNELIAFSTDPDMPRAMSKTQHVGLLAAADSLKESSVK